MSQLSEDIEQVLRDTGDALISRCDGASASAGGDASLTSLWSSYESLKQRATEQPCTVAVLALAKSGKSTLLNAILGASILPANNVPETARIIAIHHTPDAATARLSYPAPDGQTVVVEGGAAIHEHLRQLNMAARGGEQGLVADERPLEIEVPVAALAGSPAGSPSSRVTILDTPGPNEAGEDALRYKVERLAEGVDALLYLLDYTKLKTSEEKALFQRLQELNPSLLRRLCTRCFFAVNKVDVMGRQDGMGPEETQQYVAELITEQLGVPGFELRPEQIFLVSALDALRARRALHPQAPQEDVEAFRQLAFGRAWRRHADPELVKREAEEVLAASGLPELEAGVLGFLGRRAAVLHQVALLDDAERLLAQVHNLTSAAAASLRQGVASLTEQVGGLQARLARTLAEFEDVGGEVEQLEALVVDEVRARMGRLQDQLLDHVGRVLSPRDTPGGSLSHGRWPAVWSMVKGLFRRGAAEPEGAESEEELQMMLSRLHSMIYLQIETETREFWHGLEQATNARQRQLCAALNARLSALGAAIEAEVSGALGCALDPVDMRLQPPTAEQFHVNLQVLLRRGIQKEEREEVLQEEREHVVYIKRQDDGLCRRFEWWEPTRETHTEEVRVRRARYVADPAAIREYFEGMVRDSAAGSVRAVRGYVHAYLAQRLGEARGRLQAYAATYTAAMRDALDTARLGESERLGALRCVEARCAAVGELLERVQGLQAAAEQLLEGWVEELGGWPQEAPAPAAAATLAALAALQQGTHAPQAELAASQASASGSSATEVAAAYAAQQVAEFGAQINELSLEGCEAAGEEVQPLAEVALHGEHSGSAADPEAPAEHAEGAQPEASGEEDADWTLLSAGEEEDERPAADAADAELEAGPLAC